MRYAFSMNMDKAFVDPAVPSMVVRYGIENNVFFGERQQLRLAALELDAH